MRFDHSPADILRAHLTTIKLVVRPSAAKDADWSCYVSELPFEGDKVIRISDTSGRVVGKLHNTGETVAFPGVQVMVRAGNYKDGTDKMRALVKALEAIKQTQVEIGGVGYLIWSAVLTTTPVSLGEIDARKRIAFVVNARLSITVLQNLIP